METRKYNPDWSVQGVNDLVIKFFKRTKHRPSRTIRLPGQFYKGQQVYFYVGFWKKPVQRKIIPGSGEPKWRKILRKSLFGGRGWEGFRLFGFRV